MFLFILRRLGWAALTIFGVMLVTFMLFRVNRGDIAAAVLGAKAPESKKADWRHRNGYDKPLVLNLDRQIRMEDMTKGKRPVSVRDSEQAGSNVVAALGLVVEAPKSSDAKEQPKASIILGRYVPWLDRQTAVSPLTQDRPLTGKPSTDVPEPKPVAVFTLGDGTVLNVDLSGANTAGDVIDRINGNPANNGKLVASVSERRWTSIFDSQFFHHLASSATFQSRSFTDNRRLTDIIREKGPYSLSLTVPAMAFEFFLGLALAAVVAYYRGTRIDKIGVLLSVLGMCIPFLAFMIYGSWLMFMIAPTHAYGIFYRANIYLPIGIMAVASLGGMVRFYRTIILDETNRDYVRTARAKGVALPAILFKHVLRNCMLPILTNLILSIPFLIMGSLLLESYFGIPGLGDLMVSSIYNGNESILNGLVFLTAVIYTLGVLLTDLSYALFDPRIRLG